MFVQFTNQPVTNHFRLTKNIVEEIQTMLMGLESQRIASRAMIESNLCKIDKGTLAVSHPQPKIPVLPPCPRHLFIVSANLFPKLLSEQSTSIDEISTDQRQQVELLHVAPASSLAEIFSVSVNYSQTNVLLQ